MWFCFSSYSFECPRHLLSRRWVFTSAFSRIVHLWITAWLCSSVLTTHWTSFTEKLIMVILVILRISWLEAVSPVNQPTLFPERMWFGTHSDLERTNHCVQTELRICESYECDHVWQQHRCCFYRDEIHDLLYKTLTVFKEVILCSRPLKRHHRCKRITL